MVHKRPPAAGNSPAATASERSRVANIYRQIAEELGVREQQVEATVALLDGGATVPFVARYRKEITGALDDAQLRTLEERLNYLRELEERRTAILNSVREQGKLDAALEAAILAADSKGRLEDIYLPFKPKRRTKAEIAKEAGLEPLAELLLTQPENDPQAAAAPFVDAGKQVADAAAALDGARAILVERFAEDADLIGTLREQMWSSGLMASTVRTGKKTEGEKFKDYFDFSEPLTKLPSHRILALFRGEKEEILDLQMQPEPPAATPAAASSYELKIMQRFAISDRAAPATNGWRKPRAGPGAPRSRSISTSICGCGCGPRPSRKRCACSPRTCATSCWRRRPARASPWASIPASAPASRSPSSMRPARWSPPPRSIRMSRRGAGTRRWRRWASSPCSIASI